MDFYEASFFCEKGKSPEVNLDYSDTPNTYPVTIKIKNSQTIFKTPVKLYLASLTDLIAFKNSVISSYEKLIREMKEGSQ